MWSQSRDGDGTGKRDQLAEHGALTEATYKGCGGWEEQKEDWMETETGKRERLDGKGAFPAHSQDAILHMSVLGLWLGRG